MGEHCENLPVCGFFRKYFQVNRAVCRAFIREYCRGDKGESCQRKAYREANGTLPGDDMMPNGVMVP